MLLQRVTSNTNVGDHDWVWDGVSPEEPYPVSICLYKDQ